MSDQPKIWPQIWTDIKTGNWVDRQLPAFARPYARLMRLDRPIGTWLLLLPCCWGVALASPKIPDLWLMLLFAVGAVVMRGAGCTVNDIYDRKLDRMVERTSVRPLASGEIALWQAVMFLMILLTIGLGILLLFNGFTVGLGFSSLLLVFTYPLMKRVTWWPQLFLGITFNWGILMGWAAVHEGIGLTAVMFYAAGILWTLGYDTIYAQQDVRDDTVVGIKSTALLFGADTKRYVAGFYALALVVMALGGWVAHLGAGFYILLLVAAAFSAMQLSIWQLDDPENCLQRFRRSRDFGLIILAAIIIGKFV
jgi:4-hydroxybenzoate polyprenyltransferase